MGIRRISMTVLLFELSAILAQTLQPPEELESKLVVANDTVTPLSTESMNEVGDIYEIQESGKEPIAFVLPQKKIPTLREIVYYHIIERPNAKTEMNKPKPLEIDFDDSLRTFTNSHGFQFTGNPQNTMAAPAIRFEPEHQRSEQSEPLSISKRKAKRLKMRQARKTLLNKLAEIRHNIKDMNNDTTSAKARPKREYNDIPEAPKLEDIDLSQLGYMFATVEPLQDNDEYPTVKYPPAYSDDDHKTNIKDKVESIFVTLRPFSDSHLKPSKTKLGYLVEKEHDAPEVRRTGYDEDRSEAVYYVDHGNTRDGRPDSIMVQRPKNMADPITYGMNLSLDHGYVWNKLVEPTVVYEIESQDHEMLPTVPTLDVENNSVVIPTIEIDVDDQQVHLTESPDNEDFDIYVDIKKHREQNPSTIKNGKIIRQQIDDDDHTEEDDEDNKYKENGEEENSSNSDAKRYKHFHNNNNHVDKKPQTKHEYGDDEESQTNEKRRTKPTHKHKPQRGQKPNHNEKPDFFHQLLDSDKFWKWLARWTSSYMEHLTKAVKDMVKNEIKRQLQNEKPEFKVNKTKDEESLPKPPGRHDKNNEDPKTRKPTQSDGGDKENDKDKTLNQSSKNETILEGRKTNDTKSDIDDNPTGKSQDLHKFVTSNEKTTNIFILLPDASTKEIIQSIIGKPSDETKSNDKQKHGAIDNKSSKDEQQKRKDKSPNESENHKDENTKDKQQQDKKSTDKTPMINTKDEKSNNKKPVEEKPEKEKSKDESFKGESVKNDKHNDEKPEQKNLEESKKSVLKPNPSTALENNEPPAKK